MTSVVIEEIPDRVTLAVDISNCQGNCIGCHSPFLKENWQGEKLYGKIYMTIIDGKIVYNDGVFDGE